MHDSFLSEDAALFDRAAAAAFQSWSKLENAEKGYVNSRLSVGPAEIESNGNEAGAERVDLLEAEMERLPKRRGYLGVASSVAMHGLATNQPSTTLSAYLSQKPR